MATIDYKEKYEKAVQAAMLAKQDTESAVTVQTLEEIFPELRESEDERIRKAIIKFIDGDYTQRWITDETKASWIDWLEKQSEQKPIEWTMDNVEELTEFENAMMHIGGSFFGEHQGLDPNDTFVVKEQARILLEMAPKQEWSAKDENFLNATIAYLRDAYSKDKIDFKDTAKNCVNWLKSLRPQNTWKPSDEQIRVVNRLRHCFLSDVSGNDIVILDALLEQLKKLREE